jgi:hypothetical protein
MERENRMILRSGKGMDIGRGGTGEENDWEEKEYGR